MRRLFWMSWFASALSLSPFMADDALAEQFLGIEGEGEDGSSVPLTPGTEPDRASLSSQAEASYDDPGDSPSLSTSASKNFSDQSPTPNLGGRAISQEGGDVTFGGSVGPGRQGFRGELDLRYGLSRWVALDVAAQFQRHQSGDLYGVLYGPELALVLRFPNETMLAPFVGFGPGYMRWHREYEGKRFDDGGSVTANAFAALDIALTKNFGIRVQRRQSTYLGDRPIDFSDRETEEPQTKIATLVGFQMRF